MTAKQVDKELADLQARGIKNASVVTRYGGVYSVSTKKRVGSGAWGMEVLETNGMEIGVQSIDNILPGKAKRLHTGCTVGSDPEFFFKRDGEVVPSTEVIDNEEDGVTRDGFQGELNPRADSCREIAGRRIASAIVAAEKMAVKRGAHVSFQMSEIIDGKAWKNAPAEIKQFGCNPTTNVHEADFERPNGQRVKFRSAGGHIHLGLPTNLKSKYEDIVKVMDVVVGNTCVLIDRDPANARRRKYYGRAGEYRVKPYGLEYRVPSNFWLKHYVLWSMVSGLARNSISIVDEKLTKSLLDEFDMRKVRKAINENDYALALENFEKYSKWLRDNTIVSNTGIDCRNVDKFKKWATGGNPYSKLRIVSDHSIVRHWTTRSRKWMRGFESFISSIK